MISHLNYAIAILTIRIIAGILFFFQGYDKVFHVGMNEIQLAMKTSLTNKKIPDSLIGIIARFTSWVELICGFLLILGLFKYFAIYLLCFNLIIVVFGLSMAKPMWENNHVFIRLMLLAVLLLTPLEWDKYSIDYLIQLVNFNL